MFFLISSEYDSCNKMNPTPTLLESTVKFSGGSFSPSRGKVNKGADISLFFKTIKTFYSFFS